MNIDIVITSYNRLEKISKAIESALSFSIRAEGKVIVVDDASSDATVKWLTENYQEELTAKQLLLKEHTVNQGVTAAKNTGYMASNANWVVFLDSDDTIIRDKIELAITILSENKQTPIVFFRCNDNDGEIVGTSFPNDKCLSISEYVENTSYGEVLTVINREMISTEPYIAALRGYEGLGCARIIRDHGDALLSKLVLREYDQSGDDRLSSGWGFASRLGKLAKGHVLFLKEFKQYMIWHTKARFMLKIAIYSAMSLFVKTLGKT